jgi:glycosyltransferase involved in cell wall biosynthesis
MARAAVAVVPLRLARGLQNKVLEALAMAKATVASPQALAGLKGKPEVPVVAASSPREWVEAIDHLLADPGARQRLGSAGRAYVEAHYQWERCLEPFGPLLGLASPAASASRARRIAC